MQQPVQPELILRFPVPRTSNPCPPVRHGLPTFATFARRRYLAQLALLLSATSSLSSLLILASSSRQKREQGWKLPVLLSTVHAVLMIAAFALVLHEFQTRERFYLGCRLGAWNFLGSGAEGGWKLTCMPVDSAFVMATISWCLSVVAVAGLVGAGLGAYGAEQDGYSAIGDGE